jgi:hypothetical protein
MPVDSVNMTFVSTCAVNNALSCRCALAIRMSKFTHMHELDHVAKAIVPDRHFW